METKVCKKCGIEKNLDEFRLNRKKCRQCERDYSKEYRNKNHELCLENTRKWRENNREKIREYNKNYRKTIDCSKYELTSERKAYRKEYIKKWRIENKEHIKIYKREKYREFVKEHPIENKEKLHNIYVKNREKILKRNKQWRENNHEKYLKSLKEYQIKNQDKIKAYREKYKDKKRQTDRVQQKLKRETNDIYRLKVQIRNRINCSIARKGYKKTSRTQEILGCDYETFIRHLLQTFKDTYGYEWDRIEKVHIDHIIPLATAKTEEEVLKLNNYKNLQLLKELDNLHKSDKLNWSIKE